MKKTMILGVAVMTALTFASCSKDEVSNVNNNNINAIGFDASTGKTRASVSDLSVVQGSATGFGIYATNGPSATQFINNLPYGFVSGSWTWIGSPVMWPTNSADYPVNFYAYFPKNGMNLTSTLIANYTIAADPANQIDYLAANHTGVLVRPSSSNVTINFRHILSKIDFKVVTDAQVSVEVQSIKVKQVGDASTFDFTSLSWTANPSAFTSSPSYMNAPLNIANKFVGQTTPGAVTGSSGSLMLMPQVLNAREWNGALATLPTSSYIEVVYRVYETSSNKDIVGFTDATTHPNYSSPSTITGPLFVKVAYAIKNNWEMSKAYTYTISLGTSNATGGNLITGNFIDQQGNEVNLPVVDPGTGGQIDVPGPITDPSKPIGFVVSVENWGAPDNTNLD